MKYQDFFMLLVFLISSFCSFSQSKKEQQVAAAVEKLRLAMISGERTELESIASDQLNYGHSSGKVETKQEFVESIVSGKSDFVTCDFTEQKITLSGKAAVVYFILSAKTNDNGKPGEVNLKIMTVWKKEKSGWKMLARQAVKVQK